MSTWLIEKDASEIEDTWLSKKSTIEFGIFVGDLKAIAKDGLRNYLGLKNLLWPALNDQVDYVEIR